jgi:hypothetical protein
MAKGKREPFNWYHVAKGTMNGREWRLSLDRIRQSTFRSEIGGVVVELDACQVAWMMHAMIEAGDKLREALTAVTDPSENRKAMIDEYNRLPNPQDHPVKGVLKPEEEE